MQGRLIDSPISWPSLVEELCQPFPADAQLFDSIASLRTRPLPEGLPSDRWLAVSNLHKSIRYGLGRIAAASARALWTMDPDYFLRRVPVIALEDVSLGNLPVVAEVLAVTRNTKLRKALDDKPWPEYLAVRMAATLKSRSACDLASLAVAKFGEEEFQSYVADLLPDEAAATALDKHAPILERVAALMRLDKLPTRGEDQRTPTLSDLADKLGMPPLVREVMVQGRYTHGLNAVQPLVFELAAGASCSVRLSGVPSTLLSPAMLASSLDAYTRSGLQAYRMLNSTSKPLRDVLRSAGLSETDTKAIRMAMFHLEGSILNRRLVNGPLEELKLETERLELQVRGIGEQAAPRFLDVLSTERDALNRIRRAIWSQR